MPPRLSIHTITTKPWPASVCIDRFAASGATGITFWRHDFDHATPHTLGQRARSAGLTVTSLARGGFFPATSQKARQSAIDDNLTAIDQAHELGSPSLVLVCGSLPHQPLETSRAQITDGIAACLEHAQHANVTLAIEPLHPMYADSRSAINTMSQAAQTCESLGNHPNIGIACDVYHTWWDDNLDSEIERSAANGNLTSFHICDWLTPTTDLLNDRGIMGEGCIDITSISQTIDNTGFTGHREVEIFSSRHWARDQQHVLDEIVQAYSTLYPA